ncbi:hypothetical protein [Streptococcus salivarius]
MKILKAIKKTRADALVFFIKRLESLPYYLSLLKALIDLTNGGKELNKSVMSANCKDFEIIIINMLTL